MKNYLCLLLSLTAVSVLPTWVQENPDSAQPLINSSTRTTLTADNPRMIVGFTVPSNPDPDRPFYPKSLLIRAIGQGLSQFDVANPLLDPVVQVFDAAGNERVRQLDSRLHQTTLRR
ncbi:MAG: hypothetical protein J6386_10990 [Candidatus Synoicihabitans palmerolidicus]|nr:hypothetical protein [Candidatus Synoicihabitans palmerolidicus]